MNEIICPKCGKENPENANYCHYCGQVLKDSILAEQTAKDNAKNKADIILTIISGIIVFVPIIVFFMVSAYSPVLASYAVPLFYLVAKLLNKLFGIKIANRFLRKKAIVITKEKKPKKKSKKVVIITAICLFIIMFLLEISNKKDEQHNTLLTNSEVLNTPKQ